MSFGSANTRIAVRGVGFLVPASAWALCFALIYAVHGAGCAMGLQRVDALGLDVLRILIGTIVSAALLLIGWAGVGSRQAWQRSGPRPEDRPERFLAALSLMSCGLFLVATIWTGASILAYPACAGHSVSP